MIKKRELVITLAVIAACTLSLIFLLPKESGKTVKISQNEAVLYTLPLNTDNTVTLDCCVIKLENGQVFMEESDCSNKICINTGKISKKNEQIICLPNKVIIEVTADEN